MAEDITIFWQRLWLPLALVIAIPLFGGCSREEAVPRQIRAHTTLHKGVSHAEPAARAERYCAKCHGVGLRGGAEGEPSCFTCHGKTWLDEAFEPTAAPPDHTVINQGFHHLPGLFAPAATCGSCHGASLEGNVTSGLTVPSCELCHTKLWDERSPIP